MPMTTHERAEKIIESVAMLKNIGATDFRALVIAMLDEAVLFAVEEDRKIWDEQHALYLKISVEQAVREASTQRQNDWQIGYDKGFAAARAKAAGIAEFHDKDGCSCAERIRAMSPTVPGEAEK